MRCISKAECEDWLRAHNYTIPFNDVDFACHFSASIPADSGKKVSLVRSILDWFPTDGESLLWITDWSIWPSSENMTLFELVRKALNETRRLNEAPGHVFQAADSQELEAMLDMCLYNFWDATLADCRRRSRIQFSHDEFFDIHCVSQLESSASATIQLVK